MSKNLSTAQRRNRNDKKRLLNLAKSILLYKETGERIVLQKEPTPAMDILGRKNGINVYDFYHGTLSPQEQERRRLEYNEKQREVNKKVAIRDNGIYKGTGAQDKKLSKKEQESIDYFKLKPEEQIAAHKAKQLIRDITRGWNCPICKNLMPDIIDISDDDIVNYAQVRKNKNNTDYLFFFHAECYDKYLDAKYKKLDEISRSVHAMNTSKELIEYYRNWGKKIIDK